MKKETFAAARTRIMAELAGLGWKVVTTASTGRWLKTPHATSPDGRVRYWFKSQAIYRSERIHDLGGARSEHSDMRGVHFGKRDDFRSF